MCVWVWVVWDSLITSWGVPGGSVMATCQCRRHVFSQLGSRKIPWRRKRAIHFQYSCLEKSMQRSGGLRPWDRRVGHSWACTHARITSSSVFVGPTIGPIPAGPQLTNRPLQFTQKLHTGPDFACCLPITCYGSQRAKVFPFPMRLRLRFTVSPEACPTSGGTQT